MFRRFALFLAFGLSAAAATAQNPSEVRPLESGKPVERTIAGGESQTYQIALAAGQFIRVVAEQRGMDVKLSLAGPDGKPLIESDLTSIIGAPDSLAYEAAAAGTYQMVVRANGAATRSGAYVARLEVKDSATDQDHKRITAESLLNEALALRSEGKYTDPRLSQKLEQALALYRELEDPYSQALTLNWVGLTVRESGVQLEKAIEAYEQSLSLMRSVKLRAGESRVLLNLAQVFGNLGRPERVIQLADQALEISRTDKDRDGESNALRWLGFGYEATGHLDKGVEYQEQALAIMREMKANESGSLMNLGGAYSTMGRFEKAIEYYKQALAYARERKQREYELVALANLAGVVYKMGNLEKALEYSEQSLVIARAEKIPTYEASLLLDVAFYDEGLGRLDKAIEYSEMSVAMLRELGNPNQLLRGLYMLALRERTRNPKAARVHVEEALKIAEATRANLMSPESRAAVSAARQSVYKLYSHVLMLQHQAEPGKGLDALAFETSEFRRARSLLDLLSEASADIREGVDAALLQRERTAGQQLAEKARLLTRAKPEQVDALKKEIGRLETEYERAQAAIRKASPHYAALTQPQPIKLNEIQAQLDADTVLLEYSLGAPDQDQSYLWAITRDSLTSYNLPKGVVVEKSAREVYELLTARSTNKKGETASQRQTRMSQAEAKLPAAALELSKTLLAPVAAQLGKKRLVIVADGALQYIPFAMLPDPAAGNNQPLVVGHEIVSLPSASTLLFQRKELDGRAAAPKTLAVIADPVFDRSDDRVKTPAPEAAGIDGPKRASAADTRTLEHLADDSDDERGRRVIRRLPFTRQEAERLMSLAPKNTSFRAIDFDANRSNVLSSGLGEYRYIHFATHGVLDTERPGLSALVLSTVDADGKPRDGFLRANDIYNMKLSAELVVLSACQTGLGKEVKGEGLIGLTRGFMYAGAKRVVVSLWSVNDKATADLMANFYRGMLKYNERPAAALRAAQIEMWKQKKWQSPYYWAAFTMQGEWK